MSYVIQNFAILNKSLQITPKFKFLLFLMNIDTLFFFFKKNFFLFLTDRFNLFYLSNFFSFLKYFFADQFMIILKKVNVDLIGFYDNNLFKSAIHHIYASLRFSLKNEKFLLNSTVPTPHTRLGLTSNLYFFSIKIINTQINKKIYKNIFYYLMLFSSVFWYQNFSLFKFYLNFILANTNLHISPFYNNYFMHIYNS